MGGGRRAAVGFDGGRGQGAEASAKAVADTLFWRLPSSMPRLRPRCGHASYSLRRSKGLIRAESRFRGRGRWHSTIGQGLLRVSSRLLTESQQEAETCDNDMRQDE